MLARIITENGVKKIQPLTADVGAGAPVGSLAMMYKKSAPSGYLYCDGSTFNATTYPALYAYLGSNTLPDYREFAPVGAEQNTTDTIAAHDVYAQGEGKDDRIQQHTHQVYNSNPSGGTPPSPMQYTVDVDTKGYDRNVIGYVKGARAGDVTRGKRKAVYFYIKATSGLAENQQENVLATINENNSYSITEQATGAKWIDGKPIYRKVIDFGALPNATEKSISSGITNIDTVVDIRGYTDNGTDLLPIPYAHTASQSAIQIWYTLTDGKIKIATGTNRTNYTNTKIIVEYTKTTD